MWMKPQIYSSRERHESLHCFVKQTWNTSSLEAEQSSFECYLSTNSAEPKVILHQPAESSEPQPSKALRKKYKQSWRGKGCALWGTRAGAPKPGCEIPLVQNRKVKWPLINGHFQTHTVYSKWLPVVLEVAQTISQLTDTTHRQVLLPEYDQLGTPIWVKVCTSLQLRFTTTLCLPQSRTPASESWQRARAGASLSPARPCKGRGTAGAKPLAGVTQPARTAPLHSGHRPQGQPGMELPGDTTLQCGQTSDSQSARSSRTCKLPKHLSCFSAISIRTSPTRVLFTLWIK